MKNIEQELKLALTEREYQLILQHATSSHCHTNHYFVNDTVIPCDVIRIREYPDKCELTCKKVMSNTDGIWLSHEYNQEITVGLMHSMMSKGISPTQFQQILAIEAQSEYRYVGELNTNRSLINIEDITFELDKNEYLGITDYELEYECNDRIKIDRLKSLLIYKFGIIITESKSKSRRFIDKLASIPMLL